MILYSMQTGAGFPVELWVPRFMESQENIPVKFIRMVNCHTVSATETRKSLSWVRLNHHSQSILFSASSMEQALECDKWQEAETRPSESFRMDSCFLNEFQVSVNTRYPILKMLKAELLSYRVWSQTFNIPGRAVLFYALTSTDTLQNEIKYERLYK